MTTLGINLNCASKKEHVPKIERLVCTVKEHFRSSQATMLMHINGIGFLDTISRHIMFSTEIMIKNQKLRTLQMG